MESEPKVAEEASQRVAAVADVRGAYERLVARTDAASLGTQNERIMGGIVRVSAWFGATLVASMPVGAVFNVLHPGASVFALPLVLASSVAAYWWARTSGMRVWQPAWPEHTMGVLAGFALLPYALSASGIGSSLASLATFVIIAIVVRVVGIRNIMSAIGSLLGRRR